MTLGADFNLFFGLPLETQGRNLILRNKIFSKTYKGNLGLIQYTEI